MKTLITGANGFLGAWVTRRLLEEGHEVTALVRKNSDLSELQGCSPRFAYGDVTDKNSLQAAFKGRQQIFHLAGVVAYREADRPLMDKVNVRGTQNVVEACAEMPQPAKLLHVSSVVAIGSSFKPQVLDENTKFNLSHLNLGYFETKKQAEDIVRQAAWDKKIEAVCVNPSTIYGFGDARKGSRKNQVKVANGNFPFYTSGGVNVVAVEDVVDGIMLAVQKGQSGERYILANQNYTIKNLFEKIAFFAGAKPPRLYMPNWLLHMLGWSGDRLLNFGYDIGVSQTNAYTATMFHWFDSHKAQKELGFKPKSADKAIENSVRWMKDNGYLK